MAIFGPINVPMEIQILHLVEGARRAKGLTVIIDVFRAFSTACYIMNNGAEKIIPVSETIKAFRLKKKNPEFILLGEEFEKKIPGFEYGNSPSHILNTDFAGMTIVQRTSSGTLGIVSAVKADEIITGSFVNAGAIIRYILKQKPENLSLVCMGYAALRPIEEDTLCAEYIVKTLNGKTVDFQKIMKTIKNTSAKRFYDPANASFSPPEDVDLCLDLSRFNFILKAEKSSSDLISLKRIHVS
jgi:2-phosphosulfolactate phosphatase